MALEPGTKLGPFEIVSSLPAGALGEAYKASDTKRNRSVTLQLVPANMLDSAAFAERLELESRAVASLKHPHIASIYEVGRHEETAYVVSEFVEGETLAERLKHGPLELEESIRITIAVADALDKAHRKGLVHRNLNPSSIVLAGEGVKLVDFGLAMPSPVSEAAILESNALTRSARVATAAPTLAMPYQAPEQFENKAPDARSDLFALGAILYEMVAGKPAFEGKTQALLIAAISSIDPEPLSKVQPSAPPALDYIVKRCLAKTPQKRLQTAWDLLCQLRWIVDGSGQGAVALAAPGKKRERLLRIALVAVSLLIVALATLAYLQRQSAAAPLQARFILPNLGFMFPAGGSTVYISPNGKWLITSRSTDDPGLDAIALNSVTKQSLLNGIAVYTPFWKPDSQEFAFWEGGKLKRASVIGGPPTNIADVPAPFGGGSWSSSGVIVYSSAGSLYRVLDVGGETTPVAKLDMSLGETEHVAPYFLPDGRRFLYLAVSSQASNNAVYVGSLDSAERTRLFDSESKAVYAEPGYVLFNRADVVYAQPFDANSLKLSGEPVRIADGVPVIGFNNTTPLSPGLRNTGTYAVSQTGVLTYRLNAVTGRGNQPASAGDGTPKSMIWGGGGRGAPAPVGPQGAYAGVDMAPDGKRFAVHRHEGGGGDIWLYDPEGDRMQRWTTNVSQENSMPIWSPDGKRIAFASRRNNRWGIYVKAADNTGAEERIVETDIPIAPMSWVKDQLVYWVDDAKTRGDIWAVPMTGERKAVAVLATTADELFPQLSADGKWIAYQAPDSMNAMQIWVNSFPKAQNSAWQITNEGGLWPRWRGDGKALELYFVNNGAVQAVTLRVAGEAIQPGVPRQLFGIGNPNLLNSSHYAVRGSYLRFAVSSDGQSFLFAQPPAAGPTGRGAPPRGGRGTVAEGLLGAVERNRGGGLGFNPPNEISVILNWPRLMKKEITAR